MASIKKSVMLSDLTQKFIGDRSRQDGDIAWSENLNEGIKALSWIASAELPELTQSEWQTILNVYAGSAIDYTPPYRVASDMMDDRGAISIDELEPEYAALVRKIHGMTQAQQWAILDFAKRFWARDWSEAKDWAEIFSSLQKR